MLLSILIQTSLLSLSTAAISASPPQDGTPPVPETQDEEGPGARAKRLTQKQRREAAGEAHDRELQQAQWTDEAGNPILPGVLPAGTTESAQAAWHKIAAATGFQGEVKSFDLHFNLLLRQDDIDNQMAAHLLYLRPNYIYAELGSGRSHLRGPEGDFLIDGKEVIRLVGREGAEDKKQIDRTSALVRNFVGLVDPTKLRILSLVELAAAPAGLPVELEPKEKSGHPEANVQELGAGLKWLSLRSPDFELENAGDPERTAVRSCLIGYEPNTMDIEIVVIQADRDAAPRAIVDRNDSGTLLVVMGRHKQRTIDNVRVPLWIGIFDVVDPLTGKFRKRPASELILEAGKPGSFRAELKPEDFLPPRR